MPEMAKLIKVEADLSNARLTIDGEVFPWYIAEDGVRVVHVGQGQVPTVQVDIIADEVQLAHVLATSAPRYRDGEPT